MIPGMNPRQMQQMMRRMGISQQDLDASEVIIKLPDKQLIFKNPGVSKTNIQGQEMYQVTGTPEEQAYAPEITEDDITTIVEQTGASKEDAKKALEETGDLAEAILKLQ